MAAEKCLRFARQISPVAQTREKSAVFFGFILIFKKKYSVPPCILDGNIIK